MVKRATRRLEEKLRREGYELVAGADEVGKGAWAGPLIAAAVILDPKIRIPGVRDSKFLPPKRRQELFVRITKSCLAWSVGVASVEDISNRGIRASNVDAIRQAALRLTRRPDLLLVDAIRVPVHGIDHRAVADGDSQVSAIAAASIVAKVIRDELMRGLHRSSPQYRFDLHKGYGTALHERLLRRFGPSADHRLSFEPMKTLTQDHSVVYFNQPSAIQP